MKVKLLKKVRKRFSYWKNSKGKFYLIDKKKKTWNCINKTFCKRNNYAMDDIQVSKSEFYFRVLKTEILRPFGYSWVKIAYKKVLRISQRSSL